MFYSQFILAKKGPLGTIWIAAHLERKLRKNQVADTDIGVSVDSILFPEVPIALRLSSHLLLGVVRIYSRKVNYLFDDCSEALLKIKQAFRSTAVDLPPEESTAPYHSITLPETFDLDDFELPDNDIFQGNYVDRHVSSREQITLQDTMEGVVYSTSQFGLDERFGDADTSGLDLDEELLLDKVAASGHSGLILSSDADPQASVQPMMPLEQDGNHKGLTANLDTMQVTANVDQIEGGDVDADFMEYAQAPSTPGLMEEPNMCKAQETSACDDHLDSEEHNITECAVKENAEKDSSKSDIQYGNKNAADWSLLNDMNPSTVLDMHSEENGCLAVDQDLGKQRPLRDLPSMTVPVADISADNLALTPLTTSILDNEVEAICPVAESSYRIDMESDGPEKLQNLQNGNNGNIVPWNHSVDLSCGKSTEPQGFRLEENTPDVSGLTSACQQVSDVSDNNQESHKTDISANVEIAGSLEKLVLPSNAVDSNVESNGQPDLENVETEAIHELKVSEALDSAFHEEMGSTDIHVLQRCNILQNQTNILNHGGDNSVGTNMPSDGVGLCLPETSGRVEACHASGASMVIPGCHATDGSEIFFDENHVTEPASCEGCDLPAPERLLSVPEGLADASSNLLVESTPHKVVLVESDGGGDMSKIISGKKRSFTESTLTVQSLDSVESPGITRTKRTAESIPDDDDLLSSILVGRRSSVLKMKPTPPPEIRSMKRPRSALRMSSSKRKVLMDDTMVLHGDTIRLHLTSTEDIRRVRKKAPCTHAEISVIQKQFLQEEIFNELILSGVSVELASLHCQTYDLSAVRVFKNDAADMKLASQNQENNTFMEAANGMDLSTGLSFTNETAAEWTIEPRSTDDGKAQPIEISVPAEKRRGEDCAVSSEVITTKVLVNPVSDIVEPNSSREEQLEKKSEVDTAGGSLSVDDAINPSVTEELHRCCSSLVSGDRYDISAVVGQSASLDNTSEVCQHMDAPGVSFDHQLDITSVEMEVSTVEVRSGEGVYTDSVFEEKNDEIAALEIVPNAESNLLLEETEGYTSGEIRTEVQADCSEFRTTKDPSSTIISSENGGCSALAVAVDQAIVEFRRNEQEIMHGVEVLNKEVEYNGQNTICSAICGEERKTDSSCSADANMGMAKFTVHEGENLNQKEDYTPSMADVEMPDIDHCVIAVGDDFDFSVVGHDTEFLNVDDDEVAEADDDNMPGAEETRFIENSGWSSRTRAVAKYLQVVFDKEAERGREIIPMDNLLVGKTRKEASRMFFEALVLKTKDFIHVAQESPFGGININPRAQLMKSDF